MQSIPIIHYITVYYLKIINKTPACLLLYMCLLVCMCTRYVQCLQRPKEGIRSPETRVTSDGAEDQIQVLSKSTQCLYLWNHLLQPLLTLSRASLCSSDRLGMVGGAFASAPRYRLADTYYLGLHILGSRHTLPCPLLLLLFVGLGIKPRAPGMPRKRSAAEPCLGPASFHMLL